jgi:hypothetical protein
MRPQDYPNVKRLDDELQLIQDEINVLGTYDKRAVELRAKRGELLQKRRVQIDFNKANETKD